MFSSRPTENGWGMAETPQPNSEDTRHARPEDPETNTRPPGNGDRDETDTERSERKLNEVLSK
jgi:hypothetical protein